MIFFKEIYKLIFSLLFLYFCSAKAFSQKLVFDNIKTANVTNQSIIKNGDEINGYFFIYENDTIDDYSNTYNLKITDNKLHVIHETKVVVPQDQSIYETSSNGSEIILSFLDIDKKKFQNQVYDLNGMKKFSYVKSISRKEFRKYNKIALGGIDEYSSKSMNPIDSVGFISSTIREEKQILSISIDFFGSKENIQWSYVPKIGASYFFGEYLGIYKNVVYLYLYSFKESIYTEKPEVFIVGLDVKTGKELFKKPADGKYRIVAKGIKILNDGAAYLYGSYYIQDANIKKDNPVGFALWKINEDGIIIDEKYTSFENDFNDYLNVTNKGKIKGIGYIYFQNMVQTASGDLYILGEGFDKKLNAYTIISAALFGLLSVVGQSFSKQVSTDMLLIKLDTSCKIKDITIFDKKNSNFFSYAVTQTNKKTSSFSFWYFSNKSNVLNSINVKDDKITSEKIRINAKSARSLVLPASSGQTLLLEYFRNEKQIEMHFESALN